MIESGFVEAMTPLRSLRMNQTKETVKDWIHPSAQNAEACHVTLRVMGRVLVWAENDAPALKDAGGDWGVLVV